MIPMHDSFDMADGRTRRRSYAALFMLPLLCAVFALLQLREQQPYWGGRMSDPSYTYLLSSLHIATFSAPTHIDHPGTTVQEIGALTLRALHLFVSSDELTNAVLADPEWHAQAIGLVLIALAIGASLAAGIWVFRRTGRLGAALVSQAGPLLIANVLAGYSGVRPEPLLIAGAHLWAAVWILWAEGQIDLQHRPTWLAIAALGGVCLATKYTFAPLLVIPLVLLPDWRGRACFSAAGLAAFSIMIAPAWPRWHRMASWVFRLAARDGGYGSGVTTFRPREGWRHAILNTVADNSAFSLVLASTALVLALGWRRADSDSATARRRRLSLAFVVALAAAVVFVAKQASGSTRYLLPTAATAPLAVYALWRWQSGRLSLRLRRLLVATGGAAVLAFALPVATRQIALVHGERAAALEAPDWIARNLPGANIVPYYGASSIPYSLGQAEVYLNCWAPTLARLYPQFIWFDLWGANFKRNFTLEPAAPPDGVFYLEGVPLEGELLDHVCRRLRCTLTPVWNNRVEVIYRVALLDPATS